MVLVPAYPLKVVNLLVIPSGLTPVGVGTVVLCHFHIKASVELQNLYSETKLLGRSVGMFAITVRSSDKP